MANMAQKRSEPLELVTKTTTVIELIADRGSAGTTLIARELDMSKASAYRICQTLVSRGWLSQNQAKQYQLGPVLRTTLQQTTGVASYKETLFPYMTQLHRLTQESIHLTHLERRLVVYDEQLVSTRPVRSVIKVGGRSPAHAVSPGLIQLAFQTNEYVENYLSAPLARFTPGTIATPQALRTTLAEARERGYAFNLGGYRYDVGGVARAILVGGRPVAAISICCPVYRLSADVVSDYAELLMSVVGAAQSEIDEVAGEIAA
ncbi:IclR family transcriptional regulator [Leucobacter muris]|uniref:IclR family transcriptional regulator n=2 Tax=Microbacteriaceae TaxID=85023 RepID=A0ABX5QIA8_9MICO|nr:IclR family transcriptional regulator [Leucobacter muris]